MTEQYVNARVNADDTCWIKTKFEFDPKEPYVIKLTIFGSDPVTWDISRVGLREAVFSGWPSGELDVIMIRFGPDLRVYLRDEVDRKCTFDFSIEKIKPFLAKTYTEISHSEEQALIEREVEKWTSS